MNFPLVSVIIPTYNRAKMIVKTLDSIFAQTYSNFEVIVVDDGSKDDTLQVLDDYKQKQTRKDIVFIILKQKNAGAPAARNNGLLNANGEYIVFFDSDDLMLPNRIEEQISIMITENSDCCACGYLQESNQLECYPDITLGKSALYSFLQRKLFGSTQSWMFKKSQILKIGGYDESLGCRQDFDIVFRVLITNPEISIIKQVLSIFVDHEDNERIMNRMKNQIGYTSIVKFHSKVINYCIKNKELRLFPLMIHRYCGDVFSTFPSVQYLDLWREFIYMIKRNRQYPIFSRIFMFILTFVYCHYYFFRLKKLV